MTYNRSQYIDHIFQEIDSGKLELSDIRRKMKEENIDDEEITVVFRLVDKMVQKKAVTKASNTLNKNLIHGGLLFCGFGVLMTVGSYLKIIDVGGYHLIAFGPMFAGVGLALVGFMNLKK